MRKFLKILGPFFLAISVSALSIFAPPKPTFNDSTEKIQRHDSPIGGDLKTPSGRNKEFQSHKMDEK